MVSPFCGQLPILFSGLLEIIASIARILPYFFYLAAQGHNLPNPRPFNRRMWVHRCK